jgi:hypothetical protein
MAKKFLTPYATLDYCKEQQHLRPLQRAEEAKIVEFLVIAAALGLLDSLAAGLGADSRDGDDWIQHRSV